MGRGSILSFGLFILPIAVTTGVLVGLDAFRASTGQPRLFRSNKVNVDVYCQKAFGIHPTTDGQDYTRELLSHPNPHPSHPCTSGIAGPSASRVVPDLTCWGLAALRVVNPGLHH
jgi:hypothetical protein